MPRYFFNLVGDEGSFVDTKGVELTNVAAVREYAYKRAAELTEETRKIKGLSSWRIQIQDENGENIISMSCESPDFM